MTDLRDRARMTTDERITDIEDWVAGNTFSDLGYDAMSFTRLLRAHFDALDAERERERNEAAARLAELIAAIDKERDSLRARLAAAMGYARHVDGCGAAPASSTAIASYCTCGLAALLREQDREARG